MMNSKLIKPVIVRGRSIIPFGRRAEIKLVPSTTNCSHKNWELSAKGLLWRRLVVRGENEQIEVVEHLFGLLFLLGLDQVDIQQLRGQGLPYDNSAGLFYTSLSEYAVPNEEPKREVTPQIACAYRKGDAYVRFDPGQAGEGLTFKVHVAYAGYGGITVTVNTDSLDIRAIASARSQIKPAWFHRLTQHFFGGIVLSQQDDAVTRERKLRELAYHRILDLCGALYMLKKPGEAWVGTISTHLAGHQADIEFIKQLGQFGFAKVA